VLLTWADGGALLAVLVWGANFPVLKQVMAELGPLPAMCLRGLVSSAVLVGFLAATGRWRRPTAAEAGPLLGVSLLGFTLNQLLYSYGLHLTTASHSGLIFTITPLVVFGMAHLTGQARMARLDVLGLALGLAGAVLIVGVPWQMPWVAAPGGRGGPTLLGDLLTVGAAVTWAWWTLLAAPVLRRHGTILATAWITAIGSLALVPAAAPALAGLAWTRVPWTAWAGLLFASTVAGALGSLLWYAAVRRIGAARTAIYANLESFFAVLAAAVMLGERVEGTALVGGAGVVAGVLLTRRPG
jgi:drug/metabolite transporter (DMT)-like permease